MVTLLPDDDVISANPNVRDDLFSDRMDNTSYESPLRIVASLIDSYKSEYIHFKSADYLNDGNKFDVIKFWVRSGEKYGVLSKIALWILAIPASNVLSESLFSKAGYLINPRSRLATKDVDTMIVLS